MDYTNPLVRFATSGLLISLYGMADHLARRAGGDPLRSNVRPPKPLAIAVAACLLAFYCMIRPLGGPVWGGLGNIVGVVLSFLAMGLRLGTRNGVASVRQPDVASRVLFYFALPLAVGVTWGWLVLTLPAVATSVWWCRREDRLLIEQHGEVWRERVDESAHWAPKVW